MCEAYKNSGEVSDPKLICLASGLTAIQPPDKINPYTAFVCSNSSVNLLENVQHSWWLSSSKSQTVIRSEEKGANFCILYTKFLNENSNNLIKFKDPCTVDEYCLLREIIWMFHSPLKCKFFNVTMHPTNISIQKNVSVPSITVVRKKH